MLRCAQHDTSFYHKLISDGYLDEIDGRRPELHFGSIACVNQVIDVDGYFAENILPTDRKTIALEMESYGVSRACKLINKGDTVPLIIKSVMDTTTNKSDSQKSYAAWTSAKVVQFILEKDII